MLPKVIPRTAADPDGRISNFPTDPTLCDPLSAGILELGVALPLRFCEVQKNGSLRVQYAVSRSCNDVL